MDDDEDALARLESALDRIEARPPAPAGLAERIDTLMTQLRDALAHPPQ